MNRTRTALAVLLAATALATAAPAQAAPRCTHPRCVAPSYTSPGPFVVHPGGLTIPRPPAPR